MEEIKKITKRIKKWVSGNRKEFVLLCLVLLIGAFLRLFRIGEYMTFLGDEGRDAMVVRRLLVDLDPILIGPGTSIGGMYLGPLYYYFMAPMLLLWNFSPVGPSVGVALLGIATIFLVWKVASLWFGQKGALVAAFLYAIAPTVIIYSRSSWNPNIMPFFSLLLVFSLWKVWRQKKYGFLVVAGICFAFALQSHYLGLLLAGPLAVFWLIALWEIIRNKGRGKDEKGQNPKASFVKNSIISLAVFSFLMSPLLIFDIRHGWMNFSAMKVFFTERQTTVSAKPWNALPKAPKMFEKINTRLIAGKSESAGKAVSLAFGVFAVYLAFNFGKLKGKEKSAWLVLFVWIAFSLVGLGLYKQEIYDHYFGFFCAAPFLLFAGVSQKIIESGSKGLFVLLAALVGFLTYANLAESPVKYPPPRQAQRSMEVARKIIEESRGERFNLAVLAERNYEDGYQYFLEAYDARVVEIDAQRPETIASLLFTVCELPREKCDPAHSPKTQIANFGWSRVVDEWEVGGVILYKMLHAK